ncbi:hypothetical protein [Variovorax sp. LjRoot175]|uniref:hypothetical protein n=1 Tax=Variovorax sp. LjRoot175 TaxID=3342276 RepID=UPI003F5151C9
MKQWFSCRRGCAFTIRFGRDELGSQEVRTPRAEIGTAAASMLLALMRGESPPFSSVDLGYQVIVRQSA